MFSYARQATDAWRAGRPLRALNGRPESNSQLRTQAAGMVIRRTNGLVQIGIHNVPLNWPRSNFGGVAEWFKAPACYTEEDDNVPRVRIPPPPPILMCSFAARRNEELGLRKTFGGLAERLIALGC
jgi:hypothetical protein